MCDCFLIKELLNKSIRFFYIENGKILGKEQLKQAERPNDTYSTSFPVKENEREVVKQYSSIHNQFVPAQIPNQLSSKFLPWPQHPDFHFFVYYFPCSYHLFCVTNHYQMIF